MLDLYAIYVLYFGYGSWCLFGLVTAINAITPDISR